MNSFRSHRLIFEYSRIRKMSLLTLISKTVTKIAGLVIGIVLLPISAIFHLAGYRHITIFTDRIGHLALEPDCLIKEQLLGHIQKKKWILLAPFDRVANEHLLIYWQPYFIIVRNKLACFFIANLSRWGFMLYTADHYARTPGKPQASYRIYAEWGDKPPILSLNGEDEEWADFMMPQLGLPSEAWFVCVHAREGRFSPVDEEVHSHRNSNIMNTVLAIEEIVRRGGWVIRIGDPTMTPLPRMHGVIDYAHHPLKSQRLDVILCARARFMLATSSGIALVGSIFGVPCAISNLVPAADLWYGPRDISIPKPIWSERESRYLSLAEAMANPLGSYKYAKQFKDAGLAPRDNTPEDIWELVIEMFSRLEGTHILHTNDVNLQKCFKKLIPRNSHAYFSQASFGLQFIRKNSNSNLSSAPTFFIGERAVEAQIQKTYQGRVL
jgi:putative glycosyltransferase (TIGR04372 family)